MLAVIYSTTFAKGDCKEYFRPPNWYYGFNVKKSFTAKSHNPSLSCQTIPKKFSCTPVKRFGQDDKNQHEFFSYHAGQTEGLI